MIVSGKTSQTWEIKPQGLGIWEMFPGNDKLH